MYQVSGLAHTYVYETSIKQWFRVSESVSYSEREEGINAM